MILWLFGQLGVVGVVQAIASIDRSQATTAYFSARSAAAATLNSASSVPF